MYSVRIEPAPDDHSNRLVINSDEGEREYWDGGEPEDNSFIRDWAWVESELQTAYAQGIQDALKPAEGRVK